jgi:hypothetical protein
MGYPDTVIASDQVLEPQPPNNPQPRDPATKYKLTSLESLIALATDQRLTTDSAIYMMKDSTCHY